jgi:hypothetical protein
MQNVTSGVAKRVVITPVLCGVVISKDAPTNREKDYSISVLILPNPLDEIIRTLGISVGEEYSQGREFKIILDRARFQRVENHAPLCFQLKATVPFFAGSELEVILSPE